jgi:type III pantothenate kinase
MTASQKWPIVAVDIGNSRIKLGLFDPTLSEKLPQPLRTLDLVPSLEPSEQSAIFAWLEKFSPAELSWFIGSVQRDTATRLVAWLRDRGAQHITLLASGDLKLEVSLPRPDMVGIDRLLGALAANHVRPAGLPAIIVDLGTAITVDLVSLSGAFMGGSILPGINISAIALEMFTDLLPQINMHDLLAEPPPALGTNTIEAMRSGIYWGAVGGVRQLIELLGRGLSAPPEVFLTGGAAPRVAPLVAPGARYEPHLVLAGIALAASHNGGE